MGHSPLQNIHMTEKNSIKVVDKIKDMQTLSSNVRKEGRIIAFVPTMGALHEGHLSLIRKAKEKGEFLVVSIFVNPSQFGPDEDYKKYTRDLEGDLRKIKEIGVDVVFSPDINEIYPDGFETYVEVQELQKPLCGQFRPGHFKGVATVVLMLFNIVKPDIVIFGEKDYQQLKIIQKMARDLHLEVEVVGLPIIREDDGLALSSRNVYLSKKEREQARALSEALGEIRMRFNQGQNDISDLIHEGREVLNKSLIHDIDYLEIRNGNTLECKEEAKSGDLVALAAKIGHTRLIDNIKL